jgi:protein TonB
LKAQAIAQANLAGGGEAARGARTSPLPAGPDRAGRRARGSPPPHRAAAGPAAAAAGPDPPRTGPAATARPAARGRRAAAEREQEERRRQLLRLLAEIEKRINDENARPKKRYISPATREEVYALYYDALRRASRNAARATSRNQGRKLYGELTMNVTVDAAGRVVEAEIVRPSARACSTSGAGHRARGLALRRFSRPCAGRPTRSSSPRASASPAKTASKPR